MTTLPEILQSTRDRIPALRARRAELDRMAANCGPAGDFEATLRRPTVALIAEVKRRSPSAGAINEGLNPVDLATRYAAGGAAAISVLTDGPFFGGSIDDMRQVAAAVATPVLRKDFILDDVQLVEARAEGASAALLIVRALEQRDLERLVRFAISIGLTPLVEAHTASEVGRAIDAGARVIGINARDLDTFRIDTAAAWQMLGLVPPSLVAIAESGMATIGDVSAAANAGADAVLIGSALAGSADPTTNARAFSAVARRGR